jgi:hypothetical protein
MKAMPAEVQLALGRIFLLASRPAQPGDVEQYERARKVVLDAADEFQITPGPDYEHCWVRDRFKGAQGD